ncbi:hypothetical protein [Flavobacterium sp.]|uniref:hypothetical protein n=1 Tax=Flavobacterium sp. TaxID=239 RepID=UPI00261A1CBB|nr:hypothetical protein [Flavobacterium sp.]
MKKIFLFFCAFHYCIGLKAQENSGYGVPPQTPTPPAVYSFTKYGDFEVDQYRGLANVTIPLHEVKLDEVKIPLVLKYYTGGIKVAEEAGTVGLGWDLNLPAVIQTVKDVDDLEIDTRFCKLPNYEGSVFTYNRGYLHPNIPTASTYDGMDSQTTEIDFLDTPAHFVSSGNFLIDDGHYVNSSTSDFVRLLTDRFVDSEADVFNVTLNGVELVMIRKRESVTLQPQSLSQFITGNPITIINGRTDFRVELISASNSISWGFKITDPAGIQYFFEATNDVKGYSYSGGFLQYAPTNGNGYLNFTYITTKFRIFSLTKIITSLGKEIKLNYEPVDVVELIKYGETYYKRIGEAQSSWLSWQDVNSGNYYDLTCFQVTSWDPFQGVFYNDGLTFFQEGGADHGSSTTMYFQSQKFNFLTSIETPFEEVSFSYSERIDYNGMKKLDSLTVRNSNLSKVKKYNFLYSYFDSSGSNGQIGTSNSNLYTKRLKLMSVGLEGEKPYLFQYHSTLLPPKNSYSVDYWGYFNGKPNTSLLPSLPALGYSNYYGYDMNDNFQNNFTADLNYATAGTLQKIYYPTGGFSEFFYDLHRFDNYLESELTLTPPIKMGYGLRIEKINSYSDSSTLAKSESYNYYGGKAIFKKSLSKTYNMRVLQKIYNDPDPTNPDGAEYRTHGALVLEASLSNYFSASTIGVEDYIGYDMVEVTDKFDGRVVTEYSNTPAYNYSSNIQRSFGPMQFQRRFELKNGLIKNVVTYDSNGAKKYFKENFYRLRTSYEKRYAVRVNKFDDYFRLIGFMSNYDEFVMPSFLITSYPIFANSWILSNEIETEFYENGAKKTQTNYDHDNNNNLIAVEKIGQGQNNYLRTTYQYSLDNAHISKNLRNLITTATVNQNNDLKEVRNYTYEEVGAITRMKEAIIRPNGTYENNQIKKAFFDEYDESNNLIKFHEENGTTTAFIWGYNKQYIIAKIENFTGSILNPNIVSQLQNASNSPDTEYLMQNLFQQLRGSLPESFITTFNYKPLVGVTKITDVKGLETTYVYDQYNRLIEVRDHDNHIIQANKYHFKD